MSNPIITFRLSYYQLARGLQVIRSLEPSFKLTSFNQLVKVIYTDYLAKMTLGQSDFVSPEIMLEVQNFISTPKRNEIDLETLANQESTFQQIKSVLEVQPQPEETESKISTVTDFSPPTDWIDQEI